MFGSTYRVIIVTFLSAFLFGMLQFRTLNAQDAVFTQFNLAPLQFNPAFTGNTYAPMLRLNSRVQWPGVSWAYNTAAISYDQYFDRYNSGFGLFISNDIAGGGIYNTLRFEGLYAYGLKIREGHYLKIGLSLAMVQNRLNWDKLIFLDQLDPDFGYTDEFGEIIPSEENRPDRLTVFYPDLSAGLLYYSEFFFVGISLKHANTPDPKFIDTAESVDNGLSSRYSIHAGIQIPTELSFRNRQGYLHPLMLYSRQANLQQLNVQFIADLGTIYAGIGYRHGFNDPDAVLFSAGIEMGMYTIAYSYDLTVSGLSANTGGSHELGIAINFDHSEWFEKPLRYSDCFEVFR